MVIASRELKVFDQTVLKFFDPTVDLEFLHLASERSCYASTSPHFYVLMALRIN